MADTLPLADPLDRVSDAMLSYVRESVQGHIPRVQIAFTRSPSDLPGTTSDNEWEITLTVSAIEKLEDDGTTTYGFCQSFQASGPSKESAISGIVERSRIYLQREVHVKSTQLRAAEAALDTIEKMPVLMEMWPTSDPSDIHDGDAGDEYMNPCDLDDDLIPISV